jgi:hypothetical protein
LRHQSFSFINGEFEMKRIALCLAVCGLLAVASIGNAQVNWTASDGGPITLNNTGGSAIPLAGVDLASASGNLIPGSSAAPFQFFIVPPTDKQAVYGILGNTVNLGAGSSLELTTGVKSAPGDTVIRYGSAGQTSAPIEFVPEPATGLLAALGGLALMLFRRR